MRASIIAANAANVANGGAFIRPEMIFAADVFTVMMFAVQFHRASGAALPPPPIVSLFVTAAAAAVAALRWEMAKTETPTTITHGPLFGFRNRNARNNEMELNFFSAHRKSTRIACQHVEIVCSGV